MNGRQVVRKRQGRDLFASSEHQIVGIEDKSLRSRLFDIVEGWQKVLRALELSTKDLHSANLRRLANGLIDRGVPRKGATPHHCNASRAR